MEAQNDGSIVLSTKVDQTGLKKGMNTMKSGVSSMSQSFAKLGGLIAAAFSVRQIINFTKAANSAYKLQLEAETKLETVMRQRIGATDEEIQKIKDLTAEQQKLGIVGDEVQLAGAQQLATFVKMTDTLETLIPAMNHLVAQQYGYEATAESTRNVANLMGKALMGQASALRRVGITFSEAEENIIKYGNETERAAMLAKIITNNVGEMNYTLAQTDIGRQKQLSNTFGDIKEQFGQAFTQISVLFLPILRAVADILEKIAAAAQRAAQSLADMFGRKSTPSNAINTAIESQNDLTEAIEETSKAQKGLVADFDELTVLPTTEAASNISESLDSVAATSAVNNMKNTGEASQWLTDRLNELRKAFSGLSEIDTTRLTSSLGKLGTQLQNLAKTAWDKLLWGFKNVITPLTTFTAEEVLPRFFETLSIDLSIFNTVLEKVSDLAIQFYEEFLKPVAEFSAPIFLDWWDDINKKLTEFSEELEKSSAWQDLKTILSAIYKIAKPLAEELISIVTTIGKFKVGNEWVDFKWKLKDVEDEIGIIAGLLTGDFSKALKHAKELMIDNKIDKAKEKFENFKNAITPIVDRFKQTAKDWAIAISKWWEEDVKPWFTVEKWNEVLQGIVDGFAIVWNKVYDFFAETMPKWWNEKIKPWFTKEKWQEMFSSSKDGIKAGWQKVIDFFNVSIPDWFNKKVKPWFTKEKWQELGKNILKGLVNPIIVGLNNLIDNLNKFSIKIPKLKGITDGFTFGFNIPKIPKLAKGGVIPPNHEFMAVLGDQKSGTNIEAPLDTIKQAMADVISQFGGNAETNSLLRELISTVAKGSVIVADGKEIAKTAYRGDKQIGVNTLKGQFAYGY